MDGAAFDPEAATLQLNERTGDAEAQPRAIGFGKVDIAGAKEIFANVLEVFGRNADTGITDSGNDGY